jgi:hypothetical protein
MKGFIRKPFIIAAIAARHDQALRGAVLRL